MQDSTLFYLPQTGEMQDAITYAKTKIELPASMWAKACLLVYNIYWSNDTLHVKSQSDENANYTVRDGTCTCPHWSGTPYEGATAPIVSGKRWCKHLLAVALYKRILLTQLETRLRGQTGNKRDLMHLLSRPNTYLLLDDEQTTVYAMLDTQRKTILISRLKIFKGQRSFKTDFDAISFGSWLCNAQPLPEYDDDTSDASLAVRMFQSALARGFGDKEASLLADSVYVKSWPEFQMLYATP